MLLLLLLLLLLFFCMFPRNNRLHAVTHVPIMC
jgi:hypothetical protein